MLTMIACCSLTILVRLPEIDPEEEEMQQAQLQLQQQQDNGDLHEANPPPPHQPGAPAPGSIPAARAEPPVARGAIRPSPPLVQRQPHAPLPRAESARSDTARADRLAKIQRMLEAEASEASAAHLAPDHTIMDEFPINRKRQPTASALRVDDRIGSSRSSRPVARMEVDEDDDSFDLTPSQELAMNEATLRELERDLARRSASPVKRASPQKRKLDVRAGASLPAKRAPTKAKVINLVDSDDNNEHSPSTPVPRPIVSSTQNRRKARERSKTVETAEVIDLSD